MKLKLTAPGFETYTGQMGVIFFKDGVSVSDVRPIDAVRVAAVIGAEWEDGSPANIGQMYLDNAHTPAPMFEQVPVVAEPVEPVEPVEPADEPVLTPAAVGVIYTEDQLATIADAQGIAGLRQIAEAYGIKGNSIRGLIDAIIKAGVSQKAE